MSKRNISTYLNDHLAGSVVAIELLELLEKAHAHTPIADFLSGLRTEILADRSELEALMKRLDIPMSTPRKVAAWLAEKLTELKLRLDDPAGGALRLLESLEAIAIGVDGKRALWRALSVANLQGLDLARLEGRAADQRQRLEKVRLEAAQAALRI